MHYAKLKEIATGRTVLVKASRDHPMAERLKLPVWVDMEGMAYFPVTQTLKGFEVVFPWECKE
jgi:hypothetical protein